ncbi:hypothetical protein [Sphingobacterium sp. BIGb0165]|uniref:hypothetical protein n=1 Tax=Sphingobacterium sp. BIGb0165 TaxID=2940615 RepID=UPI002167783D|nr:hypothetical protein [Sphingobacterium sp. BIGb0165]MCS4224532.1 hypothetical protein [Sphingobacterium sp. BIGb0165]
MYKINIICFTTLFSFFSSYCNAQTENKAIDTEVHSTDKGALFFNKNKTDRITLPFGYSNISKQGSIDAILSTIQNEKKLKELHALNFEKVIKKDLISLPEEYDVFLPFSENVNDKYDIIKIASNFLSYGAHSLYFVAVYNTVRYAEPFIEKVYLISTKDSKPIDMKRIYLHHEGEMGFAHYTLFNIAENYIISIQDYEFSEAPLTLRPLHKYQILPSGKFSRYYDNDGFYKNDEEQGMVKNHQKDGKWMEFKSNRHIDLQRYSEFTDPYTYLEAEYKNGSPVGTRKFYKLLQKYNEETGEPILNTRKKGRLIYTEIYKEGILEKREFPL